MNIHLGTTVFSLMVTGNIKAHEDSDDILQTTLILGDAVVGLTGQETKH